MPVVGVASGPAAFSQAKFDQLKQQVDATIPQRKAQLEQQTNQVFTYIPKPETEGGPGGRPPKAYTTQSSENLYRQFAADGYPALKIADAFFPFTYQGHMLNSAFHVLDPVFGGQKVDYHL